MFLCIISGMNNIIFTFREHYSRKQLVIRVLFGFVMYIPHIVMLFFVGFAQIVYTFCVLWLAVFTGRISKDFVVFQTKMLKWQARLEASMMHMVDDYPDIGLNGEHQDIEVVILYQEEASRMSVLMRILFGGLLVLPHLVCIWVLSIIRQFTIFISIVFVLFTTRYPYTLYELHARMITIEINMSAYISCVTHTYPEVIPTPTIKKADEQDMSMV